jgi:hypothetical protein
LFLSSLFFEHEVNGAQDEGKRHQVVPSDWFFQVEDGKHGECDDFLDGFELESGEAFLFPQAVRRDLEAVLEESDSPADEDDFPESDVGEFEVTIPGEGHETAPAEQSASSMLPQANQNQTQIKIRPSQGRTPKMNGSSF